MKPTPKQQRAIDFDTGKCLVAAGAGSGKTKVLTSRIFQLVASGKAKLSELLVLTFTNKAAHEMKMRVRDLFAESGEYASLLPEVEVAKIMTFDAFALDLVKRYRYELGLDKGIDLLEDCFFQIKTEELLDEVLESHYERSLQGEDTLFADIAVKLSPYDDDNLKTYVKALLSLADRKSDREAFLQGGALTEFTNEKADKTLEEIEEKKRSDLRCYYDELSILDDAGQLQKDYERIDELLATSGFDELGALLTGQKWPVARGLDEELKEARSKLKERYVSSDGDIFKRTKKQWIDDYLSTRPYVEVCLNIAREVSARLDEWKKEHGVYGFSDIASLAKKVVSSSYGEKVRKQFRYVMIDEYQDTNDLQEDFVDALGVENVFLVGDIKQSIYGFRNANPRLFAKKFEDYGKGKGGTLITLDDNFRSREQVLDSINDTFSSIMSESLGGIDYQKGQSLQFGNHSYDATKDASDYGPEVIAYEKRKYKNDDHVAEVLAKDILFKIQNHYQVKDGDGTRDITYKDFAILTRKTLTLKRYEKVFRSLNIPVSVSADHNAFDLDVMMTMSSLVEWLSLYEEEKPSLNRIAHCAVALKRSFLFAESDQDVFFSMERGIEKDPLSSRMKAFHDENAHLPLPDFIEKAIADFEFPKALLRLGEVKANFDLLSYFVKLSRDASRLGMGLKGFASFLAKRRERGVEMKVSTSGDAENAVSLMTIHKSKGLEFPFVYFPSLNDQFRHFENDGAEGFISSLHYGPIMPVLAHKDGANLFALLAKKESGLESKSEEMRLLYVALTRPKEAYAVLLPMRNGEPIRVPKSLEKSPSHLGFLFFSSLLQRDKIDGESLPLYRAKAENGFIQKEVIIQKEPQKAYKEEESEERLPFVPLPSFEALRYGKRLHRYMEVVNLTTKDCSFISDPEQRKKIEKVLALPIFDSSSQKKAYREFEFIDETGKKGRIDLFFLFEDHIEVVDYKSSSLEDPEYRDQVRWYMDYLGKLYGLPVEGYLLSLSKAVLVKVE